MTDTAVRRLLRLCGAVAVTFGLAGVARGLDDVRTRRSEPGHEVVPNAEPAASTDSEYRFYAAWYAGAGLTMLDAAQEDHLDPRAVRRIGATWLLAVAGRLASLRRRGRPHPLYLALTAAESAIGANLISWSRTHGAPARSTEPADAMASPAAVPFARDHDRARHP